MPPLPEVIDTTGREIRLTTVLGRGGEGVVYGIAASNDYVAKIYHKPLSADRSAKIQLMSSFSNQVVKQVSAWPVGLILKKSGREAIGLVMPKIMNRKDIHKLYSPKSRRAEFKRADWRLLIRASVNTARSFGAIHSTGCVIGDVNEGSVLVAEDATVRLIDCDSFQVIANGKRFPCEVGVETFTPPELQGKNLRAVVRTANHDNFGLAIMVFLLLFMGRHPFAGRFLGRGDMPIPKAISELRFAYSAMRADVQMDKPPGTPPLAIVGDEVAFLFERAFAKQMVQGGRPEPAEWVQALSNLEKQLKQCGSNPSHWHHRETTCPWCPMEASTGVELFPFVQTVPGGTALDLTALWREIDSLQSPGASPQIQLAPPQPSAEALALAGSYKRANLIAFGVSLIIGAFAVFGGLKPPAPLLLLFGALLSFFGARKWLDRSSDIYKFRDAKAKAENTWNQANKVWTDRTKSNSFDEQKQEILRLKQAIEYLPTLRTTKLDQLRKSLKQAQLVRFLDNFEIDKARLDGIGDGRKRTLQSYGIETAADLLNSAVESVPGFGPVLCSTLYNWRRSLEARFNFNPATGVDPRDIDKIEQEIATERRKLEQAARTGLGELRQLHARILSARGQLKGPVEAAYAEYLQASMNYKAAGG
jgi:DNA-binding helix-hairpin-helix protein with protein kinase domain